MRTIAIAKKVLKELLRDKRTLAMLFLAPILVMWLLNAMFSANTETHVTLATVDVPSAVVKNLEDIDHVSVKDFSSEKSAKEALKDEEIDATIVFDDPDYLVDYANTDSSKTLLTKQALKASLSQSGIQALQANLAKLMPAGQAQAKSESPDIKESYQYGDENTGFFAKMIPILMGFFVFFFVFLISGMSLLKERTSGTLDRLLATPVKRSEIVFGYMISYGIIATLQTVVIVFSTISLLHLEVVGNVFDVIIVNIILSMVALAFGIFLSTLAKSEFQMMQFIPVLVMPQMFFSGIIPLDGMADWVQVIGKVLPLSYSGDALSNIILHGQGLEAISGDLIVLLLFLLVLTVFNIVGLKRYRKV